MQTATLSVKGQIVIPRLLRREAQLACGDELSISYQNGEIRLKPIAPKLHSALDQVAGCLARPHQKNISDDAIKAVIKAKLKAKSQA
jgi:AbrB family looped-hinge helix DNA binding protein